MKRLRPNLDQGAIELDNNIAERAMRSVTVGRKNYLFVSSKSGGRAAAIACTLIETELMRWMPPPQRHHVCHDGFIETERRAHR